MKARWILPPVVVHRCGGALAPENTLAGLRIAAALGAGGVEFDVMLSADRVPVVIHDDFLERTTDCAGEVCARSAARLMQCDAGVRYHRAFAGEPLPSFAQVAGECRRLGLIANVEIKCADADGQEVGGVVAEFAARLWAGEPRPPVLSSFSPRALAAARDAAPTLARALLVESPPDDWRGQVAGLDCVALHCAASCLSEELVEDARSAGLRLAAYTVNDPELARQWIAQGLDAIFTDRPDLMLASIPAVAFGRLP